MALVSPGTQPHRLAEQWPAFLGHCFRRDTTHKKQLWAVAGPVHTRQLLGLGEDKARNILSKNSHTKLDSTKAVALFPT